MKSGAVLVFLLYAANTCCGQTIPFGATNVTALKGLEFFAPLTANARWEASRAGFHDLTAARGGLAVPVGFTPAKRWPVLVVSAPSGDSSIRAMRGFTNVALSEGWVVLAAEGPAVPVQADHQAWHWAMLSSVLAHVHRCWPLSRQWPVACAGFSGGAKRSGFVGAVLLRENYSVLGVFMAGCNDDAATFGYNVYHPGETFKSIRFFLSNGRSDPIAGLEQQAAVKASMERSGFKTIRTDTFEGGHKLDAGQLREALRWFYPRTIGKGANPTATNTDARVNRKP